jgi:peptidoglycan glycosyltransferase
MIPLIAIAMASLAGGAYLGATSGSKQLGEDFASRWEERDYQGMYSLITPESQAEYSETEFQAAYEEAAIAATTEAVEPGRAGRAPGGDVKVSVMANTRLFGTVDGEISLPVQDGRVDWAPHLTFPGLESGERVGRRLVLGERAAILAADGSTLATGQGDARFSEALDVTGEVGEPEPELVPEIQEEGFPGDEPTGVSGLERSLNTVLGGRPGGDLLAVPDGTDLPDVPDSVEGRVLASSKAVPGKAVNTTIDPALQDATVNAMAGVNGGAVVLNARTGAVKAVSGFGYSTPQPPGSTFKIVTTAAALDGNQVRLADYFTPVESVEILGRDLFNAHDESCGGNFTETFAKSCNTVFAPLGIEIGEENLIDTSEKFGFNSPPTLFASQYLEDGGIPSSTIPDPIGDDLQIGSSAIGQGEVLATPLQMASVAQTVAMGGMRSPTPIVTDKALLSSAKPVRVMPKEDAAVLRSLMESVVNYGTGYLGAVTGTQVAGKTGTAELGIGKGDKALLDAWFTAFAPSEKPKYVVCVLVASTTDDGGEVAAPIASQILSEALG